MAGLISVGVSALNNAQLGLLTTQHNISNVNTDGFTRQEIVQATNPAQGTGAGFIGSGAQVETIRRIYSEYLNNQVLTSSTQANFYDTFLSQVSQIDNILSDTTAGLSPALQDFFSAVNSVAANPTSIASRQSLLSSGETLVTRFESLYSRLDDLRNGVNTQLQAQITDINSYARQIAELNQRIAEAQNFNNQPPNDLLDSRDLAIAKLNEIVKVTTGQQTDGSLNIFIGTGQSLVTGSTANTLALVDDPLDATKKVISYVFGNSNVTIPELSLENGGSLGGLLSFRRTSLDTAQNALGRIALGLAQSFNEQHQLGQDLNGALGGNFFSIAGSSPTVNGSTLNTGSLAFTSTGIDAALLTTSNYQVSYDGTNYTLTDLNSGTATTGLNNAQLLAALSNVGLSFTTSGTPNAGDRFLILPTRYGSRDLNVAITDPSAIAAATPILASVSTSNTGTGSITSGRVDATTQPPLNANLQDTVRITFTSATTFDVLDVTTSTTLATGAAYTAGASISYNGWIFEISGAPATGDVFTVTANSNGKGDNRNALALATLQSNNTLAAGTSGTPTTTYQGAYAQLVSAIGNDTQRTKNNNTAQQALLSNVQQSQQSLSGVNLDEEAANLLRFQQAYQAAARIIQTSTTLFDTILGIQ